jgi:hypothetical protein
VPFDGLEPAPQLRHFSLDGSGLLQLSPSPGLDHFWTDPAEQLSVPWGKVGQKIAEAQPGSTGSAGSENGQR